MSDDYDGDWTEAYLPRYLLEVIDWYIQKTDHAKMLNIHSRNDFIIHAFNEWQAGRLDLTKQYHV
jgi:hypothetical protein